MLHGEAMRVYDAATRVIHRVKAKANFQLAPMRTLTEPMMRQICCCTLAWFAHQFQAQDMVDRVEAYVPWCQCHHHYFFSLNRASKVVELSVPSADHASFFFHLNQLVSLMVRVISLLVCSTTQQCPSMYGCQIKRPTIRDTPYWELAMLLLGNTVTAYCQIKSGDDSCFELISDILSHGGGLLSACQILQYISFM